MHMELDNITDTNLVARNSTQSSHVPSLPDLDDETESDVPIIFDSLKVDYAAEESEDGGSETNTGEQELEDEEFAASLAELILDDDPKDEDWIPVKLRRKVKKEGEEGGELFIIHV